jgi:hypothetical protein
MLKQEINMKTNFVIILLIFITTSSSKGQGFLGSNVNAQVDSGILTIDQVASFSFGYEDSCPTLQFYEIHTSNENIIIELFYDITGGWPQVGCSQYDQIIVNPFDTAICNLSVWTNIITYDTIGTGVDTIFQADLDTFNFCETSIEQHLLNQKIRIFPNPTIDKLHIEYHGNSKLIEIIINDLKGNQVKSLNSNLREFDLGNLVSGIYIIQIKTEKEAMNKILIIE